MMNLTIENRELRFVRDMFLFASFTGLSFIDLQLLRYDELVLLHNELWIISHTQKKATPSCEKGWLQCGGAYETRTHHLDTASVAL